VAGASSELSLVILIQASNTLQKKVINDHTWKSKKKGPEDGNNVAAEYRAVSFIYQLFPLPYKPAALRRLCPWCSVSNSANNLVIMSACGKPEFPLTELLRFHHII
jgi:hypothetical protein